MPPKKPITNSRPTADKSQNRPTDKQCFSNSSYSTITWPRLCIMRLVMHSSWPREQFWWSIEFSQKSKFVCIASAASPKPF